MKKAKISNIKREISQYSNDAIQTYQMYLMAFPKAAIPIKTGIFHVFVLARNRLITLLGNLGTLFKKYRFQSNLLKKIYLLLKNKLFVKKMLFDFYCIGKASFRNNCFPI